MKRGQLSIFLLIAVVILIGGGILLFQYNSSRAAAERENAASSLIGQQNTQGLEAKLKLDMESCSMGSIIEANKRIGFRDSVKPEYESFVSTHTRWCMQGVIELFQEQNFRVKASQILTRAEFLEESIILNVTYPLEFTRGEIRLQLGPFETVLKKTSSLELSALASENRSIESSDRRVELQLERGTTATDSAGNAIDEIGIKLIDRQFDSLNNPLVLGNVVYEGLPDGARFSQPVELSIEFDTNDRYINVDPTSISIAWWDSSRKLWIALPTTIKDGIATAKTGHFTKFAVLTGCGGNSTFYDTPLLFIQKYNSSEKLEWRLNKGENEGIDGQIIIPLRFSEMKLTDQPFKNPPLKDEETLYGGEDFKDRCDNENPSSNPSMLSYCCCKGASCLLATGVQDCQKQQAAPYEELDLYTSSSPKLVSALECANDRADAVANSRDYPCDFEDAQAEAIAASCSAISSAEQPKKLDIGYTRKECLGGTVKDSNGDSSIFFIALKDDGGTCIREPAETQIEATSESAAFPSAKPGETVFFVKTISTDSSVTCTAIIAFEGSNTENNRYPFSRISVRELKVEKDITPGEKPADQNKLARVDTSAWCQVRFEHDNAGWNISGEKRACETPGTYGLDSTYSGDGSVITKCAACEFDSSLGINAIDFSKGETIDISKPIANQNCLCTIDSVDWQYCPGTIPITINGKSVNQWECKLENGVPTPLPWADPDNICGTCKQETDRLDVAKCRYVKFTTEI
jgi:hypothetical protein